VRSVCRLVACFCLLSAVFGSTAAHARANADVAALQVALKALHLYGGPIDGLKGPATSRAVKRFQRRRHLAADGVAGPRTRRALGRRGTPRFGSRAMRRGHRGWDVAALQFLLSRRGCRPGSIDGGFGAGTVAALRRCQARLGLTADGVAGPATLRALRSGRRRRPVAPTPSPPQHVAGPSGPVRFLRPLSAPISSGFGIRWGRPHQGIDFAAGTGTRVGAAGVGVVESAGWNSGGYGNLVIVRHRLGWTTYYAHLSSVSVRAGQAVSGGTVVGAVGSTGHSTGPHLHFETRLNGVPVNPLARLLGAYSARAVPTVDLAPPCAEDDGAVC
jgi:peptidoglycan hydrolase-like protein with peptidoglycan-binding domain